jgi:hypothetical protein
MSGAALVEALAASALIALAGAVIASAATTSLGAVRRAGTIQRLVAVAARELATLQAAGAPAGTDDSALVEPGFAPQVYRRTRITRRPDGLAELEVTVRSEPSGETVGLVTRMAVSL